MLYEPRRVRESFRLIVAGPAMIYRCLGGLIGEYPPPLFSPPFNGSPRVHLANDHSVIPRLCSTLRPSRTMGMLLQASSISFPQFVEIISHGTLFPEVMISVRIEEGIRKRNLMILELSLLFLILFYFLLASNIKSIINLI